MCVFFSYFSNIPNTQSDDRNKTRKQTQMIRNPCHINNIYFSDFPERKVHSPELGDLTELPLSLKFLVWKHCILKVKGEYDI